MSDCLTFVKTCAKHKNEDVEEYAGDFWFWAGYTGEQLMERLMERLMEQRDMLSVMCEKLKTYTPSTEKDEWNIAIHKDRFENWDERVQMCTPERINTLWDRGKKLMETLQSALDHLEKK